MSIKKKEIKSKTSKWIKGFSIAILVVLVLFISLVLLIRSEWGQRIIIDKAISYVTDKTNTKLEVDRIYLTFDGNLFIKNLYVEDKKKDTLLYSQSLEASIGIVPLLRGSSFELEELFWSGVVANINRPEGKESYNYQFLIDAFVTPDTLSSRKVDTTGSSMPIKIGQIYLEQINAEIKDAQLGITASLDLGTFTIETKTFDLERMEFSIDDTVLENTILRYKQTKPFPSPEEETTSSLPVIRVNNINLSSISVDYDVVPDNVYASVQIAKLEIENPILDVPSQNIKVDKLLLDNTDITYKSVSELANNTSEEKIVNNPSVEWPKWKVALKDITIISSNADLIQSDSIVPANQFNPGRIALQNIHLSVPSVQLEDQKAMIAVEQLAFTEQSGFRLKETRLIANATPAKLAIEQLAVVTQHSYLKGKATATFTNLKKVLNQPENSTISLEIPKIEVGLEDAYYFQPALRDNAYLQLLSKQPINGQVYASGNLEEIQLKDTQVRWGTETKLEVAGIFSNPTLIDSLQYDIHMLNLVSKRSDFKCFTKDSSLPVILPDTLQLRGTAQGTLTSLKTNLQLNSSYGSVFLNGEFQFDPGIAVDAKINVNDLELDQLLQNPQLGPLSLKAEAKASGATLNELDATFSSRVQEVNFNRYRFTDFNIEGELENGSGTISMNYQDENLNMNLASYVVLDSITSDIDADLHIVGADLNALGLTQKTIKTQLQADLKFSGNATQFEASSIIEDITVVYDQEPYSIDPIITKVSVAPDSTYAFVNSSFVKSSLSSNADVNTTMNSVTRQLKQYISNQPVRDTIPDAVQVEMELGFKETPVLSEVFIPALKNSDTIIAKASYYENKEQLKVQVTAPSLRYLDGKLDSLNFKVDGNKKELNFVLDWKGIQYDPIQIKETTIKGEVNDQILYLAFDFFDKDDAMTSIQSELKLRNDSLYYHINPNSLLLDKTPWNIKPENQIIYTSNYLQFADFAVSKDNQLFKITTSGSKDQDVLTVSLKNINLGAVTKFLNPEEVLASGTINGEVQIKDPFQKTGIEADLKVDQFAVAEVELGQLTLNAQSKTFNNYEVNASLQGVDVDMALTGSYRAGLEDTRVNLDFDLNRLALGLIENIADESIKQSSGIITAHADITGSLTKPSYQGSINFQNAVIAPVILGTPLQFSKEKITFDNAGIYLDQFTITDTEGNPLRIKGSVGTQQLLNPNFDLSITAKNFTAINATAEDSDLFYGRVNFSSDLKVTGDLEVPVVRGDLSITENSNFTLVVPETEVSIKEREGVVLFVNKENPDAILTRNEEENTQITQLEGFDIKAKLHVGDQSLFKIIIDKQTEDFFQVHGNGDFLFGMKPSGQMNLAGRYDITDGKYKVSLYNLVKREFNIAPGGSIVWSGDPYEAKLDVSAIYEVEANSAGIMRSAVDANQFNRDLDFLVYLNVNGELLQPEISFELDMPEENRGYAGGEVYSKVQQLNGQEAELNKQVFSLLVFNRFFPDSGSDGSSGGPASIARDNVNRVLSGQLNNFSEKLLGDSGIALDFQLDSYNTYQSNSATANTDLAINAKKKLFNDRVVVKVGSSVNVEGNRQAGQQEAPIIGNVAIEYLLTEDGKYRLKGFRKNEFESVIDGQLIVTGIAFIFNREFNRFRELWKSLGLIKDNEEN